MQEQFLCLRHSRICSESYCCDYKRWLRLCGQKRHNWSVHFCICLVSFMQMLVNDIINDTGCTFTLHVPSPCVLFIVYHCHKWGDYTTAITIMITVLMKMLIMITISDCENNDYNYDSTHPITTTILYYKIANMLSLLFSL